MPASNFGNYLREKGVLADDQVEEACLAQMVHGGRIGSSLVELGSLSLGDLATHLADYRSAPLPPEEWLESPDPRALVLVPSSLIRRYSVLPLRLEPDQIHVAMLDPGDGHQLGLIGNMARRRVVPYLLPEIELAYWLKVHCGIDPHPRYANLAALVRRDEDPESSPQSAFAPLAQGQELSSDIHFAEEPPSPPLMPISERRAASTAEDRLVDEIALVDVVLPDPALASTRTPSEPGEIAALEAELQGAADRERVIDLGLRLASAFVTSTAIFFVRGELVVGHRALADGIPSRLDALMLPLSLSSLFTQPAVTGLTFRGRPPHDGTDGRILGAIGRADAHEVLIEPISIRGRVVNLLYADNGPDALADTSVAALRMLAATMAEAYERLIEEAKRAGQDASSSSTE